MTNGFVIAIENATRRGHSRILSLILNNVHPRNWHSSGWEWIKPYDLCGGINECYRVFIDCWSDLGLIPVEITYRYSLFYRSSYYRARSDGRLYNDDGYTSCFEKELRQAFLRTDYTESLEQLRAITAIRTYRYRNGNKYKKPRDIHKAMVMHVITYFLTRIVDLHIHYLKLLADIAFQCEVIDLMFLLAVKRSHLLAMVTCYKAGFKFDDSTREAFNELTDLHELFWSQVNADINLKSLCKVSHLRHKISEGSSYEDALPKPLIEYLNYDDKYPADINFDGRSPYMIRCLDYIGADDGYYSNYGDYNDDCSNDDCCNDDKYPLDKYIYDPSDWTC